MTSHDSSELTKTYRLPDLPFPAGSDEEAQFATLQRNSPTDRRSRINQTNVRRSDGREPVSARSTRYDHGDTIQSVAIRPTSSSSRRSTSVAWSWSPPVLPHPLLMLGQAFPNLLMAISAAFVAMFGAISPLDLPLWAAGVYLPTVLLAIMSNAVLYPLWKRASLINLATMSVIFPALVIRQSVIRIPFVDRSNGTLLAPSIATLVVVVCLVLLAVACAILSQEDPEYSGVAFLPAAMLVPMLAGKTETTSLTDALWMVSIIYLVSAGLTVVASILPGASPSLIAPIAIAIEFVALTLFVSDSIFPLGSGSVAKTLFFLVVIVTVALSILIPLFSVWMRKVTNFARSSSAITTSH